MKKQPTLQPAVAVKITKGLLILSLALLSNSGVAQIDAPYLSEEDYKQLETHIKQRNIDYQSSDHTIATSTKPIVPATGPDNLTAIDELYKAFAKGDIPGALAPMDPTIEWNEAESFPYADGNPYIGPQAVVDGVFGRIGAEWEYWNLTGIELHEMANDKVLATLRYQAKYKKNGAIIDAQTAHFWTLKDGKIIRFQQFTDTNQVARAMAQ